MLPVGKNITIYKGDTYELTFRLREKNLDGSLGDYVVLTDAFPKAQIRETEDTNTVLAEFNASLGEEDGTVVLKLSSTQTAGLVNGLWDVQIEFADGTVRTYLRGTVTTVKEVTRV